MQNQQQQPMFNTTTQEQRIAVLRKLAKAVMEKRSDSGALIGGPNKMCHLYEILKEMNSEYPDATPQQVQDCLDAMIKLSGGTSPIKFLRRPFQNRIYHWYGVSKAGWLWLSANGFAIPQEALAYANTPNQLPPTAVPPEEASRYTQFGSTQPMQNVQRPMTPGVAL